jgi:hypothetical protein
MQRVPLSSPGFPGINTETTEPCIRRLTDCRAEYLIDLHVEALLSTDDAEGRLTLPMFLNLDAPTAVSENYRLRHRVPLIRR